MAETLAPWILYRLLGVFEKYKHSIRANEEKTEPDSKGRLAISALNDVPILSGSKVQIFEFLTFQTGSQAQNEEAKKGIWATVADRKHWVHVRFARDAVRWFNQTHEGRHLTSLKGSIIIIKSMRPSITFDLPPNASNAHHDITETGPFARVSFPHFFLQVDAFDILGSINEVTFWEPLSLEDDLGLRTTESGKIPKLRMIPHESKEEEKARKRISKWFAKGVQSLSAKRARRQGRALDMVADETSQMLSSTDLLVPDATVSGFNTPRPAVMGVALAPQPAMDVDVRVASGAMPLLSGTAVSDTPHHTEMSTTERTSDDVKQPRKKIRRHDSWEDFDVEMNMGLPVPAFEMISKDGEELGTVESLEGPPSFTVSLNPNPFSSSLRGEEDELAHSSQMQKNGQRDDSQESNMRFTFSSSPLSQPTGQVSSSREEDEVAIPATYPGATSSGGLFESKNAPLNEKSTDERDRSQSNTLFPAQGPANNNKDGGESGAAQSTLEGSGSQVGPREDAHAAQGMGRALEKLVGSAQERASLPFFLVGEGEDGSQKRNVNGTNRQSQDTQDLLLEQDEEEDMPIRAYKPVTKSESTTVEVRPEDIDVATEGADATDQAEVVTKDINGSVGERRFARDSEARRVSESAPEAMRKDLRPMRDPIATNKMGLEDPNIAPVSNVQSTGEHEGQASVSGSPISRPGRTQIEMSRQENLAASEEMGRDISRPSVVRGQPSDQSCNAAPNSDRIRSSGSPREILSLGRQRRRSASVEERKSNREALRKLIETKKAEREEMKRRYKDYADRIVG